MSPPAAFGAARTVREGSATDLNGPLTAAASGWVSLARRPDSTYQHYIVAFKGGKDDDRRPDQALLRANGAAERRYMTGFRAASVWMKPSDLAEVARDPAVAWIDSAVPGEGAKPLAEITGWSYTRHRFDNAYSSGWTGSGGVRVAVIGDGVECALAEITCGTGVDVIGLGNPNEDGGTSHETFAAAIIAAKVNNGIGIKGGAPGAVIHSVLAYNGSTIPCSVAADAIDVAADVAGPIRAHVINYSYGSTGTCTAVDTAIYANFPVILVAGVGNDGLGTVRHPARNPHTVAVSGTNFGGTLMSGSNYGPEVTIAAGGQNVKSLLYTGAVATKSGTSFAGPHVTAAIALIIGRKLSTEGCVPERWQVLGALTSSAVPPEPPFVTNWYGAGILDAAAAVDSAIAQDDLVCLEW